MKIKNYCVCWYCSDAAGKRKIVRERDEQKELTELKSIRTKDHLKELYLDSRIACD